jgi:hypothetical protein
VLPSQSCLFDISQVGYVLKPGLMLGCHFGCSQKEIPLDYLNKVVVIKECFSVFFQLGVVEIEERVVDANDVMLVYRDRA